MPLRTVDAESDAFASVTASVAERAPVAVGVKATLSVQLELAASVFVQLVVSTVKSAGVVVFGMVTPVTAVAVMLVSVNVCVALVPPLAVFAKAPEAGDSEMLPWDAPACANATMVLLPCTAA